MHCRHYKDYLPLPAAGSLATSYVKASILILRMAYYYIIDSIVVDEASQILLHYFEEPTQVSVRLTETMIQQLKKEDVISNKVANEIKSYDGRLTRGALRATCITVAEDHNKLIVLANVLLKFSETKSFAEQLLDDCSK